MTDFKDAESIVRNSKVGDLLAIGVASLMAAGEVGRKYAAEKEAPEILIDYLKRVDELSREYLSR
jgi:hypothetical protein